MKRKAYVSELHHLTTLIIRNCVGPEGKVRAYNILQACRSKYNWKAERIRELLEGAGIPQQRDEGGRGQKGGRPGVFYYAADVLRVWEKEEQKLLTMPKVGVSQQEALEAQVPKRARPWDAVETERGEDDPGDMVG